MIGNYICAEVRFGAQWISTFDGVTDDQIDTIKERSATDASASISGKTGFVGPKAKASASMGSTSDKNDDKDRCGSVIKSTSELFGGDY